MSNELQSLQVSRRSMLRALGVVGGGAAAAGLLSACSSSTSSGKTGTSSQSATGGSATLAFSWLENVQEAGSYIAQQRNFYSPLDVQFLPGGVSYAGEPLVQSGKALVAMTSPDSTASANNQGADLVIIGTQYQKSPFSIISLKKTLDLTSPQQLVGKKIGYASNTAQLFNGFLKANKLDGKVTSVLTSRDASILTSGQVDAFVGWLTNDAVSLQVAGQEVTTLLFADWGVPGYHLTYATQRSALKDTTKRAQLKALMTGEIRGWQMQLQSPQVGLDLTLNKYGKSLDLNATQQKLQATAQAKLIVSDVTRQHGLFWMADADVQKIVQSQSANGLKTSKTLFDNSLLAEIYQGKASI